MSRERLPNRRRNLTESVVWGAHEMHLTLGFAPDRRPLEIFARCKRPGSDLDQLLDDAAVLVSRLLQRGDSLDDIARGLGRDHGQRPTSIIARLVDEARRITSEEAAS